MSSPALFDPTNWEGTNFAFTERRARTMAEKTVRLIVNATPVARNRGYEFVFLYMTNKMGLWLKWGLF